MSLVLLRVCVPSNSKNGMNKQQEEHKSKDQQDPLTRHRRNGECVRDTSTHSRSRSRRLLGRHVRPLCAVPQFQWLLLLCLPTWSFSRGSAWLHCGGTPCVPEPTGVRPSTSWSSTGDNDDAPVVGGSAPADILSAVPMETTLVLEVHVLLVVQHLPRANLGAVVSMIRLSCRMQLWSHTGCCCAHQDA